MAYLNQGRRRAESLPRDLIGNLERPEPPRELTVLESMVWIKVVGSMAPDWFMPETHGLLIQYCRHAIRATAISKMMEEQGMTLELMAEEREQTKQIIALSQKMRLSQVTGTNPMKTKRSSVDVARKPWDDA